MNFKYKYHCIIIFIFCFLFIPELIMGKPNTIKSNKAVIKKKEIDQETLDFWEKTLKYGTTSQKESVVNYIKSYSVVKGESLIIKHLVDEKDDSIRKIMIRTLIAFSNKQVTSQLLTILKETQDDEMKIFAVSCLGDLKYRDTYKYIEKFLESENELLVEAVLRALGDTEAKSMIDKLLNRLKTEKNNRIRTQLILAIANIKSLKSQDQLIEIFENDEEKELNRAFAITGLGYIKNRRSFDVLIKDLKKQPPNIKMRILDALGHLGFKEAVKILIESVKDDEKNVRLFGIRALGRLDAKEAIEILEYKEKYDPEYKVREEAKKVLKRWKGE